MRVLRTNRAQAGALTVRRGDPVTVGLRPYLTAGGGGSTAPEPVGRHGTELPREPTAVVSRTPLPGGFADPVSGGGQGLKRGDRFGRGRQGRVLRAQAGGRLAQGRVGGEAVQQLGVDGVGG